MYVNSIIEILIDGENADTLLGALDSSFLFAYAFGMYLM